MNKRHLPSRPVHSIRSVLLLLITQMSISVAFVPLSKNVLPFQSRQTHPLYGANLDISTPTPDEAAALGARDWPQQTKRGTWTESFGPDQTATRYILSGDGAVSAQLLEDGSNQPANIAGGKVGPGTLVEIAGPAELEWLVYGEGKEMIVLTPEYEEAGLLVGVAALFVVLCGSLVAFS